MTLPSTFGRYRILELLGRGGMGVVYRGEDPVIGREVAIKVVRTDSRPAYGEGELSSRFEREFKALGKLSHPHIVTVFDVGREGDNGFIAMEYVRGASLEEVLEEGDPLPPARAAEILRPLAAALDYAHELGIVHRDIKPANILIDTEGRPKLTDFGIAKVHSMSVTRTGETLGTPIYMAPEHASGAEIGGAADQFSLAVLGYRMLTGKLPFTGDSPTAVMYRIVHEEAPRPRRVHPGLPPALDAVMTQALSKRPEDRYPSCMAMIAALEAALQAPAEKTTRLGTLSTVAVRESERPRPAPVARPKPTPARRRWPLLLAVLAAAALLAGGGLYTLRQTSRLPEVATAADRVERRVEILGSLAGRELRVDGRLRGEASASLILSGLAGEEVRLELWRDGVAEVATVVALEEGPDFRWEPFPARVLRLVTDPPGATLTLDGEPVEGVTPLEVALDPERAHRFELAAAGRRPVVKEASAEEIAAALEEGELHWALPAVVAPGVVQVEAPYPVRVRGGGRSAGPGRSVRLELPPGQHAVTLEASEVDFSRTLQLRLASGEKRVVSDFPRAVTVHVAANPANCRISVGGRQVDSTPATLRLVVGDHELTLEWPALGRSTTFTERIFRENQRIFRSLSP